MKKIEGRCQVGALVSKELWTKLRVLSITQGRTTGELMDDCIRLYLDRMDEENQSSKMTRNR